MNCVAVASVGFRRQDGQFEICDALIKNENAGCRTGRIPLLNQSGTVQNVRSDV